MSDALAVAVWRAKAARQTPRTVNIVKIGDPLENEMMRLKAEMEGVLSVNEDLVATIRSLRVSRQRLLQELDKAQKGLAKLMGVPEIAFSAAPLLTDILSSVSKEFGISVEAMRGESRTGAVCFARHVAMYLCRKIANKGYPFIGRFFGRDHSSVIHAFDKIKMLREIDQDLNGILAAIEIRFENNRLGSVSPPSEPSAPAVTQAAGATIHGAE